MQSTISKETNTNTLKHYTPWLSHINKQELTFKPATKW